MNKTLVSSRTTEISAMAIRMIEVFKQHKMRQPEADAFLDRTFAALEEQSGRMTTAINKSRILNDLDVKDEARDEAVRAVHYLVTGYLSQVDKDVKSAAAVVNDVFQKYGLSMVNKNYATETALIESLLEDLDGENVRAALQLLPSLPQAVEALRAANAEFINARVAYEKERATSNAENASALKREILDTINRKIVVYLTAMDIADPERYSTLSAEIAQVINTNNETVRRRSKRADDGMEEEEAE